MKAVTFGGASVSISTTMLPSEFVVHQNYPNPFNPSTTLRVELPEDQTIQVEVYDVSGKLVQTLQNGFAPAGFHEFKWNGRDQGGLRSASGLYFITVQSKHSTKTIKSMLLQ